MTGALTGVVAGLFGVGGGLLIVPVLVMVFEQLLVMSDIVMPLALGTSMAVIIVTSVASTCSHHVYQTICWSTVKVLAPGLLLGAVAGVYLVGLMAPTSLRLLFGLFECLIAAQLILAKPLALADDPYQPRLSLFAFSSLAIGGVSSLMGIGGGTLTTPLLLQCKMNVRRAIATSAACGLPIALAGTVGFMLVGWGRPGIPEDSLGFVYLPALIGIAAGGVLTTRFGAYLAHRLPKGRLKGLFALLLLLLGVKMLWVV